MIMPIGLYQGDDVYDNHDDDDEDLDEDDDNDYIISYTLSNHTSHNMI